MKTVVVILAVLLVACGGGNDDAAPEDNILHLSGYDVPESTYKRDLHLGLEARGKESLCNLASRGQEAFVSYLAELEEFVAGSGIRPALPPHVTPVPGQKADPASLEREYAIVKEFCEQ